MAARLHSNESDLDEMHEINVTPFIDVMLVLLIIFMIAAPLATVDVPVNLPASNADRQPRPSKPVFLTVKADQMVSLGERTITRDRLKPMLDQMTGGDKEQRIFVRADKVVPYGVVMEVMNALRAAGYLKIALVALEAGGSK
jgi:biopolymer transport protein ExbD